MRIGDVLAEAWGLYTRFFTRFFVIAAIVYLVVNLLSALVSTAFDNGAGTAALLALISTLVTIVGTFWLQGALAYAVEDVRDGRIDTTVQQVFERVRPHLGTLIVAGLLAGLGIAVGLVLLIVPGLVLLTWWCLIVPVVVFEGKRVGEAFTRSRELVSGSGWQVFGVVVITAVATGIASGIIQALFGFLGDFLQTWIGGAIASAITGPFMAVALTVMYFRLRGSAPATVATAAAPAPLPPQPPRDPFPKPPQDG